MRENFGSKIQFNKQSILRLIAIFLFFQILFCASVKRYAINRGNDLKDIVNVGVERNIYGIGIQFGLPIGYQDAIDGVGYGLRNGYFGVYSTGDRNNKIIRYYRYNRSVMVKSINEELINPGDSNLLISTSYHKPQNLDDRRVAKKEYLKVSHLFYKCSERGVSGVDTYGNIALEAASSKGSCSFQSFYYPYPFELSFGYNFGFRVGINLWEVLDFLLGIFGSDPFGDDTSYFIFTGAPQPLTEKKDWESKLDALDEKMDKRLNKK